MRRSVPLPAVLAVALVLLAPAGGVRAAGGKGDSDEPEPGVTIENVAGGRVLEAVLPGRLRGYALPRRKDGRRDVILLVTPRPPKKAAERKGAGSGAAAKGAAGDGGKATPAPVPCNAQEPPEPPDPRDGILVRIDTSGPGRLETLAGGLATRAATLDSADVDGDGAEEALLIQRGEIDVLGAARQEIPPTPKPLVSDARIAGGFLDPSLIRYPDLAGRGFLPIPLLGRLGVFGPRAGSDVWGNLSMAGLEPVAVIHEGVLRLDTPVVRPVGTAADGKIYVATGPRRELGRRLRTLLIDPLASGEDAAVEIWSRLPEPERVLESFFTILDGRPALIVTTRSAEKLSFFAEKRLRVFYLEGGDRSRVGQAPILAVESGANLWQAVVPWVVDLDGDGREDLVLGYWKGIKDDTLVLDAYYREPDGSFSSRVRRTRFDAEHADRSILGYGPDLDGDGHPDLVLKAHGQLEIHRGRAPERNGQGIVGVEPAWSLPGRGLSPQARRLVASSGDDIIFRDEDEAIGALRLADLDGDGRREILSIGSAGGGLSAFRITWLGTPAAR